MVESCVEASKLDIPSGFVMPTEKVLIQEEPMEIEDDPEFWAESVCESDAFGGSDSDEEMEFNNSSVTEEDDDDADLTAEEQDEEDDDEEEDE